MYQELHWERGCFKMADEVAGCPAAENNSNSSSVPNAEEEKQLQPEAISKDADVKLRPGVAPIKTQ